VEGFSQNENPSALLEDPKWNNSGLGFWLGGREEGRRNGTDDEYHENCAVMTEYNVVMVVERNSGTLRVAKEYNVFVSMTCP
jgi:hypothetical protein